jgi:hypothetical protein
MSQFPHCKLLFRNTNSEASEGKKEKEIFLLAHNLWFRRAESTTEKVGCGIVGLVDAFVYLWAWLRGRNCASAVFCTLSVKLWKCWL